MIGPKLRLFLSKTHLAQLNHHHPLPPPSPPTPLDTPPPISARFPNVPCLTYNPLPDLQTPALLRPPHPLRTLPDLRGAEALQNYLKYELLFQMKF